MTITDLISRIEQVTGREAKHSGNGSYSCCCPAHEDRRASLSVTEADGKLLLKCFAGCATEDIMRTLALPMSDLFDDRDQGPAPKQRRKPTKTDTSKPSPRPDYVYVDADGADLHGTLREPGKRFVQARADDASPTGWLYGLGGLEPVLYHLPAVLQAVADGRTIYVCEGEKDADNLCALGLTATTNAMGACKWRKQYSEQLRGADVVILPDHDEPGEKHAEQVATALHGVADRVRVLPLPDLPDKGDVSDWLEAGGTIEQLDALAADVPEHTPAPGTDTDPEAEADADADDEPQAELLFRLARAEGDLFRDPQHETYCTLPVAGHRETYRLSERGGGGLRAWLARRYREERGRTPNPAALQTAVTGICAEADIAPVKHVGLRVASTDEGRVLWLDLADADRRVVRIAGDGWAVTQDLPEDLRFLRPPGLQPLPEPKADAGGFKQLRCLLANVDDDGFRLCVAWMVAALRPDVPCPILVLTGPQGSAKSSAAKTLRLLVDPTGAIGKGTTRPPKDDKDLFAVASAQHVCCIDNLSHLSGDLADALAALTTGDGLTARRLYSDFEAVSCYAMRPLLLNGIGGGAADVCARPDLLDRALSVTLTPIADLHRVAESEYWPAVRAAAPAVLGDLCDALATALHNLPNTRLPALPRMADFALWIVAAEPALPWEPGTFLAAYSDNRRAAVDLMLETDPVAGHLRALADLGAWEGTTAELLAELDEAATDRERKGRRWPKSTQALSKHLTRIGPALEQTGLLIGRKTSHGRRLLLLDFVRE